MPTDDENFTAVNDVICGIGVRLQNVTQNGATVHPVHDDTPASKAGIAAGDTIVARREAHETEWSPVNGTVSYNQISGPIGSTIRLQVMKPDGAVQEMSLQRTALSASGRNFTLADLPEECGIIASEGRPHDRHGHGLPDNLIHSALPAPRLR